MAGVRLSPCPAIMAYRAAASVPACMLQGMFELVQEVVEASGHQGPGQHEPEQIA